MQNFGKDINPFTGDFTVTVSDINGLFFLYKIYSKNRYLNSKLTHWTIVGHPYKLRSVYREALKNRTYRNLAMKMAIQFLLKQRSKQIQTNCTLHLPSILYILSFWCL